MLPIEIALDQWIEEAIKRRASDIHFDAVEGGVCIRYRIDGLLQEEDRVLSPRADQIINRIKVESNMDIGEKRLPQDGRWYWQRKALTCLLRVSSLPSLYGETIVCRITGNEGAHKSLVELGLPAPLVSDVLAVLHRSYGLFLVCGPTGSGKTATLYALLKTLPVESESIVSLEDPVEVSLKGVVQVPIQERAGLTFGQGLRSILRQDPDTIMVGEIRDRETAQLAIQAALTGHRVLSTIHTNRAEEVEDRLVNIGVDRYLVKATLQGVLSQRLVRTSCSHCQQGQTNRVGSLSSVAEENRHTLELRQDVSVRNREDTLCPYCHGSGYYGRTAVFEVLLLPELGKRQDLGGYSSYIRQSLEEQGQQLVLQGRTRPEELARVGIF